MSKENQLKSLEAKLPLYFVVVLIHTTVLSIVNYVMLSNLGEHLVTVERRLDALEEDAP